MSKGAGSFGACASFHGFHLCSISFESKAVAGEKLGQSREIHHHRLRKARRRDAFASAVEQRDADLVVVLGAVGYAVGNGGVIVDRPRPVSSDVIGSARHGAGRADSRQTGAMERRQPKRSRRQDFGEGSFLHELQVSRSVACPANECFRERPFDRLRQIADAVVLPRAGKAISSPRTEAWRVVFALMDARETRPGGDRFDRKFAFGETLRGRGRTGTSARVKTI